MWSGICTTIDMFIHIFYTGNSYTNVSLEWNLKTLIIKNIVSFQQIKKYLI